MNDLLADLEKRHKHCVEVGAKLASVARRARRLVQHTSQYRERLPTDEELAAEADLLASLDRALKRAEY